MIGFLLTCMKIARVLKLRPADEAAGADNAADETDAASVAVEESP